MCGNALCFLVRFWSLVCWFGLLTGLLVGLLVVTFQHITHHIVILLSQTYDTVQVVLAENIHTEAMQAMQLSVAVLCIWTAAVLHVSEAECPHDPADKTLRAWSDASGWTALGQQVGGSFSCRYEQNARVTDRIGSSLSLSLSVSVCVCVCEKLHV